MYGNNITPTDLFHQRIPGAWGQFLDMLGSQTKGMMRGPIGGMQAAYQPPQGMGVQGGPFANQATPPPTPLKNGLMPFWNPSTTLQGGPFSRPTPPPSPAVAGLKFAGPQNASVPVSKKTR